MTKSIGNENTMMPEDGGGKASFSAGSTLGQYKIIRLLGRGGMGEVYEVEHEVLHRRYALKILPADLVSQSGALDRFEREAEVMSNLEHANIVRVDDFGETDGWHWLRMELANGIQIEGERIRSLQEYADYRGGRIGQVPLAGILAHVLHGLQYAHSKGVVHRDLKPANILFTTDVNGESTFKIADFGLVRLVGDEWLRSQAELSVKHSGSMGNERTIPRKGSSTRSMLGTYEYMSPEQKSGEDVDERSDIYSLGIIIFRLLTGRRELGFELPSEIHSDIATAWDDLVRKSMRPGKNHRHQNCSEVMEHLQEVRNSFSAADNDQEIKKDKEQKKSKKEPRKTPSAKRAERKTGVPVSEIDGMEFGQPWTVSNLGMELLPVMPGSFKMGSNDGDSDEKPVHTVHITEPFWMGKYQVVQKEYKAIMEEDPSLFKYDKNPVESLNWSDAVEFCKNLTEQEREAGRLTEGYEYRLPTEAEWEYVARGGTKSKGYKYAGSDNLDSVAWYNRNSRSKTHCVGEKKPNELGLHDMSGNVWEWCLDWYDKDYYEQTDGAQDPVNNKLIGNRRVLRGGSWNLDDRYCCSTNRDFHHYPLYTRQILGVRVVLAPIIEEK